MNDIKSVIRLSCNEEIDIKYFAKDDSITDTTIDYSKLLEYINEKEDEIERLNNIIDEALRKLKATKDHYKIDSLNSAIVYTIKILERKDKENI